MDGRLWVQGILIEQNEIALLHPTLLRKAEFPGNFVLGASSQELLPRRWEGLER
jgi:hypothetical protein